MPTNYQLTKSLILSGLQCPKRLHQQVHHPERANQTISLEELYVTGRRLEEILHNLFADGIKVDATSIESAIQFTQKFMSSSPSAPLFEATFLYKEVLVRVDALIPVEYGFCLIECKSSTKLKPNHIQDSAVQHWVLERLGFKVAKVEVALIDGEFVYIDKDNYINLLRFEEVTDECSALQPQIEVWVEEQKTILSTKEPCTEPGRQCRNPYKCEFLSHCLSQLPDDHVFYLPGHKKSLMEYIEPLGINRIKNIPEGSPLSIDQQRMVEVMNTGVTELKPDAGEYLKSLDYPRYFIDFETVAFAIPVWKNTRPYEALPFQWSCHIEHEDGSLEHKEFLDTSGYPPMRAFCEGLLNLLKTQGPILVYSSYERTQLRKLVERFLDLADELEHIVQRLIDLKEVIKPCYLHPDMNGSWSIKAVLPTIAPDLNYKLLGIQDGMEAQQSYMKIIGGGLTCDEQEETERQLREYCKLDSLAMLRLCRFFCEGDVLPVSAKYTQQQEEGAMENEIQRDTA